MRGENDQNTLYACMKFAMNKNAVFLKIALSKKCLFISTFIYASHFELSPFPSNFKACVITIRNRTMVIDYFSIYSWEAEIRTVIDCDVYHFPNAI